MSETGRIHILAQPEDEKAQCGKCLWTVKGHCCEKYEVHGPPAGECLDFVPDQNTAIVELESQLAAKQKRIAELEEDVRMNSHMLAKLHDETVPEADYKKLRERIEELEAALKRIEAGEPGWIRIARAALKKAE